MQTKRDKRTRIRAAKRTAGHGSKKKHRGSGHRGGKGNSSSGKRGAAKLMKVTKGVLNTLGRHGFHSLAKKGTSINLEQIVNSVSTWVMENKATMQKDVYVVDLTKMGFDKLLAKGNVSIKLDLTVKDATEGAISKVTGAGGKVSTLAAESGEEKSEE